MNKREQLKSRAFRAIVRVLLSEGKSISAIAKKTGHSYAHTKLIVEQERAQDEN